MASTIVKILIAALAASTVAALPTNEPGNMPPETNPPPPAANNDALIKDLRDQPTAIKRFQKLLLAEDGGLLGDDELAKQVVFDFQAKAKAAEGAKGGKTAAANIDNFPITTDLGISTTVAFLEKCGMNTPHVHPRATEFLTVTEGELEVGMIIENGLTKKKGASNEVSVTLKKYQGTVFPMGSIHYQFNNRCEPAVFVAALNSEDPGTNQVAQGFFGLDPEVVGVALGFPESVDGKNIEQFRSKIPANLAQAIDGCLKRCEQQQGKMNP